MKGIMIVFEGTDGSGKSTIIEAISKSLKDSYPEIDYYHWRPCFIKKGRKNAQGENIVVSDPHAQIPYGKLKSFAKFMFFNADYILGYLFKIKKQINAGHLVIFDRYYYDYYLDKIRYRLTISDKTLDFFKSFIHKPDITFLLVGDPKVLYERKKEISVDEIAEQVHRLLKNQDKFSNSVIVDVNQSIDNVVSAVMEKIRTELGGEK